MSSLLLSSGPLHYRIGENGGYSLRLTVEKSIVDYYRSLMPKYLKTNPQKYEPHISVVRREIPPKIEHWGKYEGETVEFLYEPLIRTDDTYYWFNVWCTRLEDIRVELGLPVSSRDTLPPTGFTRCFHCTIGNCKGF